MTIQEEHKELHEKIWNCKCTPWMKGKEYCMDCEQAVIGFMNRNGAGELTQDLLIGELRKRLELEEAQFEKEQIGREKAQLRVRELESEIADKTGSESEGKK